MATAPMPTKQAGKGNNRAKEEGFLLILLLCIAPPAPSPSILSTLPLFPVQQDATILEHSAGTKWKRTNDAENPAKWANHGKWTNPNGTSGQHAIMLLA
ncbi:unnamed protein product [Knipowitschia caucasica]|uniref:Uncharacterized protein n=1 Tax=Knipowitschia caucasica TaxID=637954 RepID=A0AAV2MFF9_KNICA